MRHRKNGRRGAYVVEAAAVISMVLLLLFGIFEYGRYLFVLQVAENAAREGARMAVAHTNDKVSADITQRVTDRLAGVGNQITGLQITLNGVILIPQQSTETAGQLLPDWTEASYTDGIWVEITGTYRPILPTFLRMPAGIPITVRSVMYSEGN